MNLNMHFEQALSHLLTLEQKYHQTFIDALPKKIKTEAFYIRYYEGAIDPLPLNHLVGLQLTEKICYSAVMYSAGNLRWVPDACQSERMQHRAIDEDAYRLFDIPSHMRTEDLCKRAIKRNPMIYVMLEDNELSEALSIAAYESGGMSLYDLPSEYLTEPILTVAIKTSTYTRFNELLKIHANLPCLTEAICLEAVKDQWLCFELIPDEFKTKAVCYQAIEGEGGAIEYVPEHLLSESLIDRALENNPHAISLTSLPSDALLTNHTQLKKWNRLIQQFKHWTPGLHKTLREQLIQPLREQLSKTKTLETFILDEICIMLELLADNKHKLPLKRIEDNVAKRIKQPKSSRYSQRNVRDLGL